MKWKSAGVLLLALLVCGIANEPADAQNVAADPILCQRLVSDGAAVSVEMLPSEAGSTSELWLVSPGEERLLMTNREAGVRVDLGSFPKGLELVFGIHHLPGGPGDPTEQWYFTGPAYRQPDGLAHSNVQTLDGGTRVVTFEDWFGGGDRDFNDVNFSVTGVDDVSLGGDTPLLVRPGKLDFGAVPPGLAAPRTLEVQNFGTELMHVQLSMPISEFVVPDPADRAFLLDPGAQRTVFLHFAPTEVGRFKQTLTVSSDLNGIGPVEVMLTGEGKRPRSRVGAVPRRVTFGAIPVGVTTPRTVILQNLGAMPLTVNVKPPGPRSMFTIEEGVGKTVLAPNGGFVKVTLRFGPRALQQYRETLKIHTDDRRNRIVHTSLLGRGRR